MFNAIEVNRGNHQVISILAEVISEHGAIRTLFLTAEILRSEEDLK